MKKNAALKLIAFAAALLLGVSVCAYAVPYNDASVKGAIEFEGITDADLGGAGSQIIGDFDPHGTWFMTEGFVSVTEGREGNGLLFTPNYSNENGYTMCVMRATMPIVSADAQPWGSAAALRIWVDNQTDYDVTVTPVATFKGPEEQKWVLGAAEGAYLVSDDGQEVIEPDLDPNVNSCGVIVPYGFKGYIVLPFAVKGGEADYDYCGWQELPQWGDAVAADELDFGSIVTFAIDIRVNNFYYEDEAGIIVDSFEFIGNKGEVLERPEEQNVNTPGNTDAQPGETEPAGSVGADKTQGTQETGGLGTGAIIAIAAAAAAVIAAVIIIAVVSAKKKAGKNEEK